MENSKDIVQALVTEDLYTAKKLINEDLMQKMGKALEDKLIDFGPSIFNESKHLSPKQKKIARMGGDPEEIDAEDFKKLRKLKESEELFEAELRSLVEEIEEETGEELSEEEIIDLANELLDVITEESAEDEEDDEDEDEEDESESTSKNSRVDSRRTGDDGY